jgi:hypothetical protein
MARFRISRVKGHSIIHKFLGGMLMFAVVLVYGVGPVLVAEVEHHHHSDDDHHDHSRLGLVVDHHDDDSHHEPVNSPSEEQGDEDDSPARSSHSHVVFLGADAPVTSPDFAATDLPAHRGRMLDIPAGEGYPDGPSFDLEKPPQLV